MKTNLIKSYLLFFLILIADKNLFGQFSDPSRTEYRDDAGLRGDAGAKSGFFQTGNPVNYPAGASNWWHLLDVRHSTTTNNYAMQFAGSFYDQDLYFRKTTDLATRAWSKIVLQNPSGKVGIGTSDPTNTLQVVGSIGASNTTATNQNGVIINAGNENIAGSANVNRIRYGGNDANSTYFSIQGPGNTDFLTINNGNVGLGVTSPLDKFQVAGSARFSAPTGGNIAYTRISWGILPNTGASTFDNHRDLGNVGFIFRTTNDNVNFTEVMRMHGNGNVAIGTTLDKGYKLAVNGSAIFTKAVVKNYANWPDYVFDSSYQLPSLESVSAFIKENKHLPEMPSASAVEKDGHDLGEVQKLLVKKMEEMTLYMLEQDKKIENLKKENEKITGLYMELKNSINSIQK